MGGKGSGKPAGYGKTKGKRPSLEDMRKASEELDKIHGKAKSNTTNVPRGQSTGNSHLDKIREANDFFDSMFAENKKKYQ